MKNETWTFQMIFFLQFGIINKVCLCKLILRIWRVINKGFASNAVYSHKFGFIHLFNSTCDPKQQTWKTIYRPPEKGTIWIRNYIHFDMWLVARKIQNDTNIFYAFPVAVFCSFFLSPYVHVHSDRNVSKTLLIKISFVFLSIAEMSKHISEPKFRVQDFIHIHTRTPRDTFKRNI